MTDEPSIDDPTSGMPVFWGHGPIEPACAHARETRRGQPVSDTGDDGTVIGFAICGCLLIADVAVGTYRRCSRCLALLVDREPGIDYPLWTPGEGDVNS